MMDVAAAQNTNNTTIRSILLAEKLTEQPIGPAPDPETANPDTIDKYYETVNLEQEVACLMLSSMSPDLQRTLEKYNAYDMMKELKTMFEEQAKQELFEIVKAFHACKHEKGQSVSSYLLQMKSYLDTLERLGYAMQNKLGVSLILNSLNKDYDQFVQNYNMHSMGKMIVELHAMLNLREKGIPKKAETPIVLAPKISPPPKRDNPTKDSVCHHYKEVGHWKRNCPSYQVELKKRKEASMDSTSDNVLYFNAIPHDDIYEIDMHNLYPNVSSTCYVSNKRVKYSLDSSYLWHCRLGHINKKRMDKLQRDGILQPTHDESLEKCKSCISGKMTHNPFPHKGYALESATCILNMVPTKKFERKPYEIWYGKAPKLSYLRETMGYYFYYPPENKIFVARNAEFFENSLIVQEASGSHGPLKMSRSDERHELIQEEDTQPSKNTNEEHKEVVPMEVEP
ncbi:zinc finger, CCHC-type containing protein, partial [Tanacetum coccineum]